MKPTDLFRLPPTRLPDLLARTDRAVARLAATEPSVACPHLAAIMRRGLCGVVCAEHPGAGILCPDCHVEHAERHTDAVEHTCDRCGDRVDVIRSVVGRASVSITTITTAGRVGRYQGPVVVIALGVCQPCAEAEGLPTLDAA